MLLKNVKSPGETFNLSVCLRVFCVSCACVHRVKDRERTAGFKISIKVIDAGVGEEGGHVSVSLFIAQRSGEEEFPPIEPRQGYEPDSCCSSSSSLSTFSALIHISIFPQPRR